MQQAQHEMLRAQQESINDLKKMMTLLLEKSKKALKTRKAKASSSKRKGKKEGENSTFEPSDGNMNNFEYENPESSSEESEDSETEDTHAKRSEIEKHFETFANRSRLQEVGVVRPYPMEKDIAPYPPRFKAPTLHTFDGKGSPN